MCLQFLLLSFFRSSDLCSADKNCMSVLTQIVCRPVDHKQFFDAWYIFFVDLVVDVTSVLLIPSLLV